MPFFKIRDGSGTVIAQYDQSDEPTKPDDYSGEWVVEEVEAEDLNSEPVEWWDEQ